MTKEDLLKTLKEQQQKNKENEDKINALIIAISELKKTDEDEKSDKQNDSDFLSELGFN